MADRADEFDVTLAFLLQQAAWLYERQLSQVRAQLRKVNRPISTGTPPIPSSVHGSGYAITGGGSQGMLRSQPITHLLNVARIPSTIVPGKSHPRASCDKD